MFRLDGKIAVVTGGAQGLGKAIAIALAEAGADIVIADINQVKAEKVISEIKLFGRQSSIIKTDVSDIKSVKKMVGKVISEYSKIDILVNNAGIVYKPQKKKGGASIPLEKINPTNWEDVIKVNITGVFNCCHSVAKYMIERQEGKIINIASVSGFFANWRRSNNAYCTSKGAVIMFTKEIATEWGNKGIRINAIAPGFMETSGAKALEDQELCRYIKMKTPLGRIGKPDDIKGLVVFLASDSSNFITGQTIVIDGGYSLW